MSELPACRAIVLGDDRKRVRAFVEHIRTANGFTITADPLAKFPGRDMTVDGPGDGNFDGPARTTLSALRRRLGGPPPVRLKWATNQRVSVARLEWGGDLGNCGKCTPRKLRQMAKSGDAGFAGQLKWMSKGEFPDLYFLCSFIALESWCVGWHQLKAGKVTQGGANQRYGVRHYRRYIGIAELWAGFTPGGVQLLSDWGFDYDYPDEDP